MAAVEKSLRLNFLKLAPALGGVHPASEGRGAEATIVLPLDNELTLSIGNKNITGRTPEFSACLSREGLRAEYNRKERSVTFRGQEPNGKRQMKLSREGELHVYYYNPIGTARNLSSEPPFVTSEFDLTTVGETLGVEEAVAIKDPRYGTGSKLRVSDNHSLSWFNDHVVFTGPRLIVVSPRTSLDTITHRTDIQTVELSGRNPRDPRHSQTLSIGINGIDIVYDKP